MQTAADFLNRRFGNPSKSIGQVDRGSAQAVKARPTNQVIFEGTKFLGFDNAFVVGEGIDVEVVLHDVILEAESFGVLQGDPEAASPTATAGVGVGVGVLRGDPQAASPAATTGFGKMKITQSGNSSIHGKIAGVSVPQGSTSEIEQRDDAKITGDVYGIEERTAAVVELRAALPAGTPPEAIEDAIAAVKRVGDGSQEEKEQAVRGSRIWSWIKEYGPDVIGLVIKAASGSAS